MITLKAEKRNPNVKAKKLRREGYVTGILSGKEMKEPVALQFDGAEAAKFIKANKEGTQIYLDIEGEKVDALVKNIDYNPIEKQLMALDFQALVAGEKVSTTVAVKLEHTELVQGIVEQEMEEIHYKADPANLLDTIVIDFNGYPADVRDIHVKDLPIPEGKQVHFITPEDAVVVHIGEYDVKWFLRGEKAQYEKMDIDASDGSSGLQSYRRSGVCAERPADRHCYGYGARSAYAGK